MAELTGPDSALVTYRPVVQISDSKKNEDAITLKIAGSFGATEFTVEEIATVWEYLTDFLKLKGLDPQSEVRVSHFLQNAGAAALTGADN